MAAASRDEGAGMLQQRNKRMQTEILYGAIRTIALGACADLSRGRRALRALLTGPDGECGQKKTGYGGKDALEMITGRVAAASHLILPVALSANDLLHRKVSALHVKSYCATIVRYTQLLKFPRGF